MALNPTVYAELLEEKLKRTGARTWLVNTGWSGGAYGTGSRISIQETRKMVRAILNDAFDGATFRTDETFGFEVPVACPGLEDQSILTPRETWADKDAYDRTVATLAESFRKSFDQFRPLVRPEVAQAGP